MWANYTKRLKFRGFFQAALALAQTVSEAARLVGRKVVRRLRAAGAMVWMSCCDSKPERL
jgi:hypothetical protein